MLLNLVNYYHNEIQVHKQSVFGSKLEMAKSEISRICSIGMEMLNVYPGLTPLWNSWNILVETLILTLVG
jgi:hypothetical protein